MHLKGKTAIITGASRGIGRAIALRLAREGANIAFNYHSNADKANSLVAELEALNVKAWAAQVDVSVFKEVDAFKKQFFEEFETIDILINNAGIVRDAALAMMKPEDWHQVIDTNLNGMYNMTKAFMVTLLKQKRGDIINISSVGGIKGMPRQTNYSATKGGMIAFTRSLAKEVANYGVKVNAVAPGYIETDMVSSLPENIRQDALSQVPLGRFGEPEEVAHAVNFLLSERAAYITGETLVIDGGLV